MAKEQDQVFSSQVFASDMEKTFGATARVVRVSERRVSDLKVFLGKLTEARKQARVSDLLLR